MTSCRCPMEFADFLDRYESGVFWCIHDDTIWEKRSGADQVITMYKGVHLDEDTGILKWGKGKGTLEWSIQYVGGCQSCKEPVERLSQYDIGHYNCHTCGREYIWSRESGLSVTTAESREKAAKIKAQDDARLAKLNKKIILPSHDIADTPKTSYREKIPTVKPSTVPKKSEPPYKECYWNYVNSSTYEDAEYWFNQMVAQVSLDLQPTSDGKSWMEDPKMIGSRFRSYWMNPNVISFYGLLLAFGVIVLGILGVI